jgi:hypothetical protein
MGQHIYQILYIWRSDMGYMLACFWAPIGKCVKKAIVQWWYSVLLKLK